MLLIILMLFLF